MQVHTEKTTRQKSKPSKPKKQAKPAPKKQAKKDEPRIRPAKMPMFPKTNERRKMSPPHSKPKVMELCLQIRDTKNEEWGTIAAKAYNIGTTERRMRELRRELEDLKFGWINCHYFSASSSYQIVERYL